VITLAEPCITRAPNSLFHAHGKSF